MPVVNPNSSFSKILPTLQLGWDSTSLGELKFCPRRYQYKMIENWAPKAESVHLRFGIEFHSALELYDNKRAVGAEHQEALVAAVKHALASTWDENLSRPWTSDDPSKNRDTLVRSVVDYIDKFKDDSLETVVLANGKAAVELSFRFELRTASTGEPFLLCGHIDRLVRFNDKIWISDKKAQPASSRVLTPDGWKKIGELTVGELIAGADGSFKKIVSLFPKGITKVFKFEFSDGTEALCGEDHLWTIAAENRGNWHIRSTKEIIDSMNIQKPHPNRFHIPLTRPVQHPERSLPLNPYILGALLGDGYLGGNSVALSTGNSSLIENIKMRLAPEDILRKSPAENLVWTITGNRNCSTLKALKELNLWGKASRDKFIPEQYLYASIPQREELLKGLLDTDGTWDGNYLRYQTTSEKLALGMCALVRSLGGSASLYSREEEKVKSGMFYRVVIRTDNTPLQPRKKYIKSITKVEDAETICIEIEKGSTHWYLEELYITDEYVATHNTTGKTINSAYFAKYSPDNQISLYSYAGEIILGSEVSGLIIDAVQLLVNETRFQRGIISRTPSQKQEWITDANYYLSLAEHFAANNYWPQNDKACLSKNTIVSVTRGTNAGKKITIEKLFELFHKQPGPRANRYRPENPNRKREKFSKYGLDTYLTCDLGGYVGNNKVIDVLDKGIKPVYLLSSCGGFELKATSDHELKTPSAWKAIADLNEGDEILCWYGRRGLPLEQKTKQKNRVEISRIPFYPKGRIRVHVDGTEIRLQRRYILAMEAKMNSMTLESFLDILRHDEERSKTLLYLAPGVEVHHIDGDAQNDDISNLEPIFPREHKNLHSSAENLHKLGTTTIYSIEYVGEEHVFDVVMEAPHHNFIANGLVVHNCSGVFLDPRTGELRYGCEFRPVCGSAPEVRQTLLELNFQKRIWDPLQSR